MPQIVFGDWCFEVGGYCYSGDVIVDSNVLRAIVSSSWIVTLGVFLVYLVPEHVRRLVFSDWAGYRNAKAITYWYVFAGMIPRITVSAGQQN